MDGVLQCNAYTYGLTDLLSYISSLSFLAATTIIRTGAILIIIQHSAITQIRSGAAASGKGDILNYSGPSVIISYS